MYAYIRNAPVNHPEYQRFLINPLTAGLLGLGLGFIGGGLVGGGPDYAPVYGPVYSPSYGPSYGPFYGPVYGPPYGPVPWNSAGYYTGSGYSPYSY